VDPQEIFNLVKNELSDVEREFARQSQSSVPIIAEIGRYLQEGGGKRLRPALLLLCTKLCGTVDKVAIQMAAVMEFIHTATLVHDDIIDEAETRRGRSSVNRKWGNQVTVLVGDWLYMQSFVTALRHRDFRILDLLIDLTQKMVEGELIQLTLNGNHQTSEEDLLEIARRKTAFLFAGCARIGALLGGANPPQEAALAEYGLNVGLAFQLVDDILDYSSSPEVLGKPVLNDVKEGKLTLPLIYALMQGNDAEVQKIKKVLKEKDFLSITRDEILEIIHKYSTLQKTRDRAAEFISQARLSLNVFPASPLKEALDSIPQYILDRNR
jgi:octaprenyl-diphosphate synthase